MSSPPTVTEPVLGPAEVLVVVGTRPEAIKLFPLIRALQETSNIRPVVISTGQHAAIVDTILTAAGCRVDFNLGIGRPGLTLNELMGSVMTGMERVLHERYGPPPPTIRERPDAYPLACVVHGDTSSAASGAISAFHLRIPVVHVEAGLRTGNTLMPFPEELNRQLIARIASFHLAPTIRNLENLVREGVSIGRIFVTGNTGIDALLWAAEQSVPFGRPALDDLEADTTTRVVTVTAHRRENWATGIAEIAEGVRRLADAYPDVRFVVPVHPNRLVGDVVRVGLSGLPNVTLTEPMEYLAFARLLKRSHLVITDSGGIQEEAPALDVPVLVCRTSTERSEGLEAGTLKLVGTDPDRIVAEASLLLDDPDAHAAMASRSNPYGDGTAAEKIVVAFQSIGFGAPTPVMYGPGYSRSEVLQWAGYEGEDVLAPRGLVLPAAPWPEGDPRGAQ